MGYLSQHVRSVCQQHLGQLCLAATILVSGHHSPQSPPGDLLFLHVSFLREGAKARSNKDFGLQENASYNMQGRQIFREAA